MVDQKNIYRNPSGRKEDTFKIFSAKSVTILGHLLQRKRFNVVKSHPSRGARIFILKYQLSHKNFEKVLRVKVLNAQFIPAVEETLDKYIQPNYLQITE